MTGNQAPHAGGSGWNAMPRWLRGLVQSILVSYLGASAALTVLFVYALIWWAVQPAGEGPGQMGVWRQAWLLSIMAASVVFMLCGAAAAMHILAVGPQQWHEILRRCSDSTPALCAHVAGSFLSASFVVTWVASADHDDSWLFRLGAALLAWWLFRSAWTHAQVVWKRLAPSNDQGASGPEVERIP
ncbi:Uncharacterised protein [Mycobacteroides abscessus subsp. abscessus]|uniref:hypothetical protein n=1 Tax=Mycobacteroides abscessus TaxID=36809 RepID=UPI000929EE5B|nr:hypothetical protein [Mycobacteroides abscessus]SIC58271.1 Uncharacterised protein [Mycobacteroides abscessus subsp. abscessus]SIC89343.1 Uncharacterised protein [Mycobacteroides abscessus subsp. abscessus]SID09595.1 Uncharacterised protein [Mycobacteroides abscessus subsp. abscessus]SID54277.1 Uncharacterised protein [Mycobacteroides abscessus subsp. abscessus]SKW00930.1 Uncharacterised protein [Mycobacteroides abscessus subsp. abscessus]